VSLAVPVPDHMIVTGPGDTRFTWNYSTKSSKLRALYEKAKNAQWNAATDIDWSYDIQFGTPLVQLPATVGTQMRRPDTCPVPPERWDDYRWEYHAWMTSQFLHGEQGALLATSRLVHTVPDLDDKLYAASQVTDEARHVEAFSMYLERLGHTYPINDALREMLSHIVSDARWDITYLGMQVIVEGLALAVFRLGQVSAFDPVIQRITDLVARDEARHVAFGALALEGLYRELSSREMAERKEFVKEAALLMSRRFRLEEIWERVDVRTADGVEFALNDPTMVEFRRLMFAKIVAMLSRLTLLTDDVRAHLVQLALLRPGSGARR
jgi:hypothetical protein